MWSVRPHDSWILVSPVFVDSTTEVALKEGLILIYSMVSLKHQQKVKSLNFKNVGIERAFKLDLIFIQISNRADKQIF